MMFNVAIIDDSEDDTYILKKLLGRKNVSIETFRSSIEFGHCNNANKFHFVFVDYLINGGAGAPAILKALTVNTTVRVVFISHSDTHLDSEKKYVDNPIVWGLLSKEDSQQISNWMSDRIYESENPDYVEMLTGT